MRKTKEEKREIVKDLIERLSKIKMALLVNYQGLKTKEISELREALSEKGIDFKVVKNTLLRLALKERKIEMPPEILDKPLALVFAYEDEIEPSKIVYEFSKEHENLEIFGGIDGHFIDLEKIKSWALLPSRQELYFRLRESLIAPKFKLLNLLTYNQKKMISILRKWRKL